MYRTFYGLSESPFELTSNPRFVFYTARHRDALSRLESGLLARSPLTLLLGEAGTGKTTLLRASLASERCRPVQCLYLKSPPRTREEFFDILLGEVEPGARARVPVARPRQKVAAMLRERQSRGLMPALAIDEAETLSDELFEELSVLETMDGPQGQLLPLVLAGQPALRSRLDQPGLEHAKASVSLRCELAPMELSDTASYILWRARAAGVPGGRLFTREAVTLIHECSQGIPRTISVICDNALLSGFIRKVKPVTREIVEEVCSHLDLATSPRPVVAPLVRDAGLRSTAALI